MYFYMPQVAKGNTPHVWVVNFSKVYWCNHVIKWVSYFPHISSFAEVGKQMFLLKK